MTIKTTDQAYGGDFYIARFSQTIGARRDKTAWTIRLCANKSEADAFVANAVKANTRHPSEWDGDGVTFARRHNIEILKVSSS